MTVKQLLDKLGRIALVEIRTLKGIQNLFSGSHEDFSKNGYVGDCCNTLTVPEIMNLIVSDYYSPAGCNSIIITTK